MLLRPGKEGRRGEPSAIASSLAAADVPIAAELGEPVLAEGGDTVWLDERTLLVGIGYRTNEAALAALRDAFAGVDVLTFDLPHWNGPGEVMHLMSFISPLDRDLALVYPRIAPVRLLALLAERGIEVVEVPDEEFETQGPNVLALGPRQALALDGNPETRRLMERAGVDVVVYRGEEISRKGDGGPTCLTPCPGLLRPVSTTTRREAEREPERGDESGLATAELERLGHQRVREHDEQRAAGERERE